jgi:hypothetical protein
MTETIRHHQMQKPPSFIGWLLHLIERLWGIEAASDTHVGGDAGFRRAVLAAAELG